MTNLAHKDKKPTILVFDDCYKNLITIEKLLKPFHQAEIIMKSSRKEALSVASNQENLALILLDIQMPAMDGCNTAEMLHLNDSTKHIPIIFLIEIENRREDFFKNNRLGIIDYLFKPIEAVFLHSKVTTFLEIYNRRIKLKQSEEELEENYKNLYDFTHMAVHDLKAPIRHIRSWTQILFEDFSKILPKKAKDQLDQIETSARYMGDLIAAILSFSEIHAIRYSFEPVNINKVIDIVVKEFENDIKQAKVKINIDMFPMIDGNPVLMKQLMQNLISNAIKYRRLDVQLEIRIQCSIDKHKNLCHLSVIDNGTGFDMSDSEKIFQPFQRLVKKHEIEGSGIGMAFAMKIVKIHKGHMTASGKKGEGAKFDIILPLK